MSGSVDLHIHSHKSSDGDFPVERIVHMAGEKNLAAISISDHDTTAAYPEAVDLAEGLGIEVIPSIELTTLYGGREFHLLLPFVDWTSGILQRTVARVREHRFREARERVNRLRELGYEITWEEVEKEAAPFAPLGVTIAQIMLKKTRSNKNPVFDRYYAGENALFAPYAFYRDFFMEGRPAFVPRQNIDLLEVLDLAPAASGVPVLAHPGAAFQNVERRDLEVLKAHGLQGLEVYTFYHDAEQTGFYKNLAEEFGLVSTAGSDFHGSIKPHIAFGTMREGQYRMVEELRQRRP